MPFTAHCYSAGRSSPSWQKLVILEISQHRCALIALRLHSDKATLKPVTTVLIYHVGSCFSWRGADSNFSFSSTDSFEGLSVFEHPYFCLPKATLSVIHPIFSNDCCCPSCLRWVILESFLWSFFQSAYKFQRKIESFKFISYWTLEIMFFSVFFRCFLV